MQLKSPSLRPADPHIEAELTSQLTAIKAQNEEKKIQIQELRVKLN